MSSDSDAIRELVAHLNVSYAHTILHYLYIPDSKHAKPVSQPLLQHGFQVEDRDMALIPTCCRTGGACIVDACWWRKDRGWPPASASEG